MQFLVLISSKEVLIHESIFALLDITSFKGNLGSQEFQQPHLLLKFAKMFKEELPLKIRYLS